MAFTRKFLAALGIESDKIDEIMNAHVEVTDALKAQIAEAKANTDELSKVTEQLKQTKQSLAEKEQQLTAAESERDKYKSQAESVSADLESLKEANSAKESAEKRGNALKAKLRELKYSDDAVEDIFDSKKDYPGMIEFDGDGNVSNIDNVVKAIQTDKPRLTPEMHTSGTNHANPPANTDGKSKITREEIMKIRNTSQRQRKIAENPELFPELGRK